MLVCILGMCTVGSWAAFNVGNVVLGSFTLYPKDAGRNQAKPADAVLHVRPGHRCGLGHVREDRRRRRVHTDVGTGDAAAALAGIPFGKHRIMARPVHGKKSWEGSAAMLITAFAAGFGLLWLHYGYAAAPAFAAAPAGFLPGTAVEMVSPGEWDTVTVPLAILTVLLPLL